MVLFCPIWSTVLQCGARLPIHILIRLLDSVVSGTSFLVGCELQCITFPINDPSLLCVCCKRLGATLYIHFVVHCLCLLCQCGYTWWFALYSVLLCSSSQACAARSLLSTLFSLYLPSILIWIGFLELGSSD